MSRSAQVLTFVCSVFVAACGGGASSPAAEQATTKPPETRAQTAPYLCKVAISVAPPGM